MKALYGAAVLTLAILASGPVMAQQGPVGQSCKDDITKLCADKSHKDRGVRHCLEANKDKVSAACKTALDNTGPGKGMARGMGAMGGMNGMGGMGR